MPASSRPGRYLVVGGDDAVTMRLSEAVAARRGVASSKTVTGELQLQDDGSSFEGLVYLAASRGGCSGEPDHADAERVLRALAGTTLGRLVLISSAAVNEPDFTHPGMVEEDRLARREPRNRVAAAWRALESRFREGLAGTAVELTILRPAPVPTRGGGDFFSRLFARRIALTPAGYDPPLQLLDLEDLARAVGSAMDSSEPGTFNLAPRGVIPVRRALELAGVRRLPLPRWRHLFSRRDRGKERGRRGTPAGGTPPLPPRSLDRTLFLCYSSTVSGGLAAERLGFEPRFSSAEVAARIGRRPDAAREAADLAFDDHGLDRDFIAARGRRLHGFLHDWYWRVEVRGVRRVPPAGPAILVGLHRGFMPWDGVMLVHTVVRATGRYPRFLIHPVLVKFPFLFNLMSRLGGVVACAENADRVLADGGLLAIFPEGIQGAFSYYRDAYELKRFGRDRFVQIALRNGVSMVPFVTLGVAEIFPILGKLHWRWWKRFSGWPCLPITPTFPFVPVPLPSKWHTLVLEPMRVEEEHPPEAAEDPVVVTALSARMRETLGGALTELRGRRRWWFSGSIFETEER